METLVVYDSQFGNTRKLAESMARAAQTHGRARLLGLDMVVPSDLGAVDLLLIGGPTQRHGLSARMRQFTDGLNASARSGMVAASFDTRYRMSTAISGSAARAIAKRLKRSGIHVFADPESFFVTREKPPTLEAGEIERAATWASRLANSCSLSHWCAA